ncbi:hypothetical protein J4Q44_G00188740 [Coregonus suidteri]|uniref:Uncharacterized protein n=1 Tax=Coregonus suidteri TaxID=861788 RepID=A0AAN8QNJ5_9TELE
MPRSFLVKKHFNSSKKPNYSELESPIVFISPYLYKGLPLPVIPQPEILSSVAYNPITVWTTSNLPLSPLSSDLSPISGYPSSLSDTSSKDHSGSESPRSDEDERMLTQLTDPHGVEAEKFQYRGCFRDTSERTPERSHSPAPIAVGLLRTGPTSGLTYKPIRM